MKPNLRIFTSDIFRSSDHPSISMLYRTESSLGNNHSFVLDAKHEEESEGDASRTIRRTLAFDEWDEEETVLHEDDVSMETAAVSKNGSSSDTLTKEIQDMVDALEDEIQRSIRRTFAFDEWDDKGTEILVGNEKGNQPSTPNVPFVPIRSNEYESHIAKGDKDARIILTGTTDVPNPLKTSSLLSISDARTILTSTTDVPNPLKTSSLLSIPDTKFDLDANLYAAITPSPPSNNRSRIQRPCPLYTHQTVERSNLFSTPTQRAVLHENFQQQQHPSRTNNTNRCYPKDYESMELMFREQQQEASEPSPPRCESIPRQAGAFHIVDPAMTGSTPPSTNYFSSSVESSNTMYYRSSLHRETNANVDGKCLGSYDNNKIMFEEDDVFDSPTTSTSNDSTSSTVPKFVMFYTNE